MSSTAGRMNVIEERLRVHPRHLKELAAFVGEPVSRVRYALQNLVYEGRAHIGRWVELTDGKDGKHRLAAVFHPGPGEVAEPPRSTRYMAHDGPAVRPNKYPDLRAVMHRWLGGPKE